MRKIAHTLAALGLTLTTTSFVQGGDFDALLADLSFGAPAKPQIQQTQPATALATPAPARQAPAQVAPFTVPPAQPRGFTMPRSSATLAQPASSALATLQAPAQEAIEPPVPQAAPQVDFQEVFDDRAAVHDEALAAPITGVPSGMIESSAPVGAYGGGNSCDAPVTCVPHVPANLPSSTLLQYFRSNKCNTRVWDGYRQSCGHSHEHLTGNCDCFDGKKRLGKKSDCGSCNTCP